MSGPTSRLPARPSLEQLRKQAKERLAAMRSADPSAQLADAQFALAREYGFDSWPKLVHHITLVDARPRGPRITAPVSRILGSGDVARAQAFWRDVLGFTPREAADGGVELVRDEALIRLGAQDVAPDLGATGAAGSAVVFFQTDDVAALHAEMRERGGEPTAPEKVNWIKMRMFQVRDPDGHTLWFGQTYQEPSQRRPPRTMRKIMPEFPLDDVPGGVRHYRDVLGFSVNYAQDDIGVMDRDDARVLLIARTPRHAGIGSAYVYVGDADALYAELLAHGADVQGEPVSRPWGLREFSVLDLEGNRLTFGQTFE